MKKNYNERITKMQKVMNQLLTSEFMKFNQRKNLANKCGIYAIYKNSKIIYVGYTGNSLKRRFQELMGDYRSHSLHNNLIKKLGNKKRVQNFLISKCRFKVKEFDNQKEAKIAEHFIIGVVNPKYNS